MRTRTARNGKVDRAPARRGTLHLIDLENQVGGSGKASDDVVAAVDEYQMAVPVLHGDQVVVGAGPTLAPLAAFSFPGSRLVVGHGVDGADRALTNWIFDRSWAAARYDSLCLGSGDGYFTELVADLARRGLPTTVACRPGSLAGSLRLAAARVIFLGPPTSTALVADDAA